MSAEIIFLFIIFCGLVGVFLRRNFLNIVVSFIQTIIGINGLASSNGNHLHSQELVIYFILLFTFTLIIFFYAIVILMIRRRSTLQVNELTEMRG